MARRPPVLTDDDVTASILEASRTGGTVARRLMEIAKSRGERMDFERASVRVIETIERLGWAWWAAHELWHMWQSWMAMRRIEADNAISRRVRTEVANRIVSPKPILDPYELGQLAHQVSKLQGEITRSELAIAALRREIRQLASTYQTRVEVARVAEDDPRAALRALLRTAIDRSELPLAHAILAEGGPLRLAQGDPEQVLAALERRMGEQQQQTEPPAP